VQTIDLYKVLKRMREEEEPFTITFVSYSEQKKEGGELKTFQNQLVGPLKKNTNDRLMIGLEDIESGEVRHIYIHTIIEVLFSNAELFKTKLHERI